MNKQKLEAAKKLFFILLGVDIAVTAVVLIVNIWMIGVLGDIRTSITAADPSTVSAMEFWGNFSMWAILTTIGVGVGLVMWLSTCYTYAKVILNASGLKNEFWLGVGWIFPIMNLFKPYQILNEIYKVGGSTWKHDGEWKKESGSGHLLTWWIFYAVIHLIVSIVGKFLIKRSESAFATVGNAIFWIEVSSALCIVSLIVAGLWYLVAGNLTRRLLDRNADQLVAPAAAYVAAKISATNIPIVTPSPTNAPISNSNQAEQLSQPIQANLVASNASNDLWALALTEYDSGSRNQGLWARLFSEAQGNEAAVKANYMRMRVDEMQHVIAIEEANRPKIISPKRPNAIDNLVLDKHIENTANNDLIKWLPLFVGVIVIIGVWIFLSTTNSETNRSASTDTPVLTPTPPTTPNPDLYKKNVPKEITVAYITNGNTNEAWTLINGGAKSVNLPTGVKFIEVVAENSDLLNQSNIVEGLIKQKVNAIAIAPVDSAGIAPAINKAMAAGIAVVAVDTIVTGAEITSYVATDNVPAAMSQGDWVANQVADTDIVIYVTGDQAQSIGRQRKEGFLAGLKAKKPNVTIVEVSTRWDQMEAVSGIKAALKANPGAKVIACAWDGGALGAQAALMAAGKKPGDIKIAGFDGSPGGLDMMKDGWMQANAAQMLAKIGRVSVEAAIAAAQGNKVEKRIDTGSYLVLPSNVEQFARESGVAQFTHRFKKQ